MRLNEIGAKARRFFEFDGSVGGAFMLQTPFAQQSVGGGKLRMQRNGAAEVGFRPELVLALFRGCREVPTTIVLGRDRQKACGHLAGFGEAGALQEDGRQGVKGQHMRQATGEFRLCLIPELQLLEGQAATQPDQQRLGQRRLRFGEDFEGGIGCIPGEEDTPELEVRGLVLRFEPECGLGRRDGCGRVVQSVQDLRRDHVPTRGIHWQVGQLGSRRSEVAAGYQAFHCGPVGYGQQQAHPHRFYSITVTVCALLFSALAAAEPGYVGPAACRPCHPAQFASQANSQHARALRPMRDTDIPERLAAEPLAERSGVNFSYARQAGGLGVTITKADQRLEALFEWAFGSGAQAVTPVGRYRGAFVEHRISYYRASDHAGRTIGHSGLPSPTVEAALGIRQDTATITRCFACHATAVRAGPDLAAMLPGVTCERCHGPGAQHVRAPLAERMQRTASVTLCAQCHRTPERSGRAPEAQDPASVRFQLVGLSASACFLVSKRLTCVICHDPHQDAARTAEPYVAICAGCHTAPAAAIAACRRNTRQNCLPCHMQKSTPLPHLTFTDHRIRVY